MHRLTPCLVCPGQSLKKEETWIEAVDAISGRKYYYNPETKESRWTHPSNGDNVQDDATTPMADTQGDRLRAERLKGKRNSPLARVDPTYL